MLCYVHLSTHTLARFRALTDLRHLQTVDFELVHWFWMQIIAITSESSNFFPASLFMHFAVFRKCNCCFHHLDIWQLTSPGLQSLGSFSPECSLVWRLFNNFKDMVCFFSLRMSTTNYSVLSHWGTSRIEVSVTLAEKSLGPGPRRWFGPTESVILCCCCL